MCASLGCEVFLVGLTPVECEAVDHAGNEASAAFAVTVLTVDAQLGELLELTSSAISGNSLSSAVQSAQRWLDRGNTARACSDLDTIVANSETRLARDQISKIDA
jgi:hypothetical protein